MSLEVAAVPSQARNQRRDNEHHPNRLLVAALLALLTWGALAFGAEYSWAYAPVVVFAAATGLLGLRTSTGAAFPSRYVLVALFTIVLAAVVQLIPVRATDGVLEGSSSSVNYEGLRARVAIEPAPHLRISQAVSIASDRTSLGLAFLVSLSILLLGTVRAFSAVGLRATVRGVAALGLAVAFVGIIQAAVRGEALYGFWIPPKGGTSFAPFLNENHFAGWMVMAMSLAMGRLAGGLATGMRQVAAGVRSRVLWFASPPGTEMLLTAFAVAVMALSMVITRSRGGLIGLAMTATLSSAWVIRRQSSSSRRLVHVSLILLILLMAVARGGVEGTLAQFEGSSLDWGGRRQIWQDTSRIIQDHPWTGTGLNTFGIAMLHYQSGPKNELVIEAHNDYLQLAAEGGLLLGIPILITIALFIREVWCRFKEGADDERTYWLRAGAVTGLCSIAVMEAFDFTLQMPGAAVLFVVLAAIAIHRPDYLARRREARAVRE
ncbi:MAG: O-antigen ligase family protein [Vicinamibacterales bacterium]